MKSVFFALCVASVFSTVNALEIESGESRPEKHAAVELEKYIAMLSEKEPDLSFRIGVKYLKEFPEDAKALGAWDGYAVRRKGNVIYIISPMPRGCLYGVYDFLERNSDIIWARPDEECGTICSRTKEFSVREADFREKPVFQMRGWWFCGPARHEASERWHSRVKCNFGCAKQTRPEVLDRACELGYYIGGASGHNLPEYISDSEFEVHPEYFAELAGVRRRDKGNTQFCYSNMSGAEHVGRVAVEKIGKQKAAFHRQCGALFDHWALKQADNMRLCECSGCGADIKLPGGDVSRMEDENFRSNQMFIYLNRAMDVIGKTYPDMRVDTFAYQFTAPPPDVKVHENLNVAFCPFIKNDRVSVLDPINERWKIRAQKWSKATKNIMWREYWGCASGFPRQHSIVAEKDLRWISSELGFTRVYSETVPDADCRKKSKAAPKKKTKGGRAKSGVDYRPRWDASAMEHWVLSRQMWNPNVSVDAYRDYYITRTYRSAAEPMRKFYEILRKNWFSDTKMTNYTDDMYGNAARYIVGMGDGDRLLALLDKAIHLAKEDVPALRKLLERQKAHFSNLIVNSPTPKDPVSVPLVKTRDWSKAQLIGDFFKVRKSHMELEVPAQVKTRVLMMHDQKAMHIKFICEGQNPGMLESSKQKGESFPGGDHVEVAVLLDGGARLYHCGVNFRGERADMLNGKSVFNADWTSKVSLTKTGYEVEISINLESLRIELTRFNRFGMCFARLASTVGNIKNKNFSSWYGTRPQSGSFFGDVIFEMETR